MLRLLAIVSFLIVIVSHTECELLEVADTMRVLKYPYCVGVWAGVFYGSYRIYASGAYESVAERETL